MKQIENKFLIHDRPIILNFKYLVKKLLSEIFGLIYPILLWLNRLINGQSKFDKKYNVTICAIFKDEAISLKEWIDYHLIIGIEHFYLYNNFSKDNFDEILEPYIKRGIVTLYEWPINKGQIESYKNCFEINRELTNWMFFIDIDEFICPKNESTISEWLSKYSNYPSIVIYWKMFGTSGRIEHDIKKPTIEQYINSWEKLIGIGKTVVNTDFDIHNFRDFHKLSTIIKFFGFKLIIPPVNEFKKFIFFGLNRVGRKSIIDSRIQLNHYWTKAYNSYINDKFNRGPGTTNKLRDLSYLYLNETKNISSDYSIWRFLIKLKTGEAEKIQSK